MIGCRPAFRSGQRDRGGCRCRDGTSPRCGRSWPNRSPTHRPRCRATAATRGASSTSGPTASPTALLDAGAAEQDKVAQYLHNGPEYLESMFGVWKAGLAPVNTNYRYADDELVYLWDNADAVAVVFHGSFTDDHRAHPRPGARGPALAVGRRRRRAVPGLGRPYEKAADSPPRAGRRPVGPQRRPPLHALHGRHHGHAQGRHVAPGRPVPQPGRRRHRRRATATARSTST